MYLEVIYCIENIFDYGNLHSRHCRDDKLYYLITVQHQITQHQWPQTDSLVYIYIYTLWKQQASVSWVCKHNLYSQWKYRNDMILQPNKIEIISKYAIYCSIIKSSYTPSYSVLNELTVYSPSYGVISIYDTIHRYYMWCHT